MKKEEAIKIIENSLANLKLSVQEHLQLKEILKIATSAETQISEGGNNG